MKSILVAALTLTLLNGTAVMAQPANPDRASQGDNHDKGGRKDQKPGDNRGNRAAPDTQGDRTQRNQAPQAARSAPTARTERARRNQAAQSNQDQRNQIAPTARIAPAAQSERATRNQAMPAARATTPAQRNQAIRNQAAPTARNVPFQNPSQAMQGNPSVRAETPRWSRGERIPTQYRQRQYVVSDWQQHGLRQPPRNYHWVRDDNNDFFLALITTGVIAEVISRNDRDQRWNQRYSREYTYNDDVYYQQCRNSPDPAGILIGGLIGGLLGNAAGGGGNRTGATVAGVIFGGAVGAALTSNMDCEDRSYAYKSYYSGFNSGRAGGRYEWRNPRNDHRGEFRVNSYYNDPYGFRCARFTQITYVQGRSYNASGIACRQPDGSWAIVN
jgi:Ni/Co efflux regulator RcnB/surface antigen